MVTTQPASEPPVGLIAWLLGSRHHTLIAITAIAIVATGTGIAIGRGPSNHHASVPVVAPTSAAAPGTPQTTPTSPATPASPESTNPALNNATASPDQTRLATLLAASFKKAVAEHTVHSYARDTSPKHGTAIFDDYDGVQTGDQHISIYGGHIEVRVIGATTYFTGDTAGLTKYMGFTDQEVETLHGQWLTLVASQAGYQSVTEGVTIASTLQEANLTGTLAREPNKTLDGQQVFGITGQQQGDGAAAGSTATIWIGTSSGLPVAFDGTSGSSKINETFTDWGKPLHVAIPANVYGQPGLAS